MSEPKKNEKINRLIRLKGRLEKELRECQKELEDLKKTSNKEKTKGLNQIAEDLKGYIKDVSEVLEKELKK
jgi:hypothetical protein